VNFPSTLLSPSRLLFISLMLIGLNPFIASASLSASPQDSASKSASSSGPATALRDILSAACSQSQDDFSRFLTERNKESFNRLTPAARVAFMKRFVLLNEAGKPSVTTNPSGRPIVRCDTPAGAAEIQIGGADAHENMAFLPVELRAVGDPSGDPPINVTMGLVRENGEWKILSLGVVLLDLPSLELEWDSAEADKNEESALGALKDLGDAVEAFRRKYTRLPENLSELGPPLKGPASAQSAGLVDSDLAAGLKDGYSFRYVVVGASVLGAPAKFQLAATPVAYGRTGRRSFFRDAEGTLRGADHQGAVGSETDPKLP
jgi:hypothetical protein